MIKAPNFRKGQNLIVKSMLFYHAKILPMYRQGDSPNAVTHEICLNPPWTFQRNKKLSL